MLTLKQADELTKSRKQVKVRHCETEETFVARFVYCNLYSITSEAGNVFDRADLEIIGG